MRLDFETFVITGPTTVTNTVTRRRKHGGPVTVDANTSGVAVAELGQCRTDTFSVGNPDGPQPPVICGTNSGEHSRVK